MNRPGFQPALGIADCRAAFGLLSAITHSLPRRSARVVVLLGVIVALSLADLALTMTHVMEIGLIEDNPIARLVLRTGGPGLLVAAKLASLAFAVGVICWARKRGIAEVAAVIGAVVMVWVTVRWVGYIDASAHLSASVEELEAHGGGAWMTAEVGTD